MQQCSPCVQSASLSHRKTRSQLITSFVHPETVRVPPPMVETSRTQQASPALRSQVVVPQRTRRSGGAPPVDGPASCPPVPAPESISVPPLPVVPPSPVLPPLPVLFPPEPAPP